MIASCLLKLKYSSTDSTAAPTFTTTRTVLLDIHVMTGVLREHEHQIIINLHAHHLLPGKTTFRDIPHYLHASFLDAASVSFLPHAEHSRIAYYGESDQSARRRYGNT